MMRFVIDGTKYEFDENKVTFGEARALEKVTGQKFDDLTDALDPPQRKNPKGELEEATPDITALQAFIWVAMKRTDPTLKFSDLDDVAFGDIEGVSDPDAETEGDESAAGDGSPTEGVVESQAPAPLSSVAV